MSMDTLRRCVMTLCGVAAITAVLVIATGCEDDKSLGDGHDFGDNDPDLYLAMGDSITAAGWPAILAGKLGKPVINYSSGGARSGVGASAVGGLLARYKPGYLLIMYGANDAINGADPDQTIANLQAMIAAARANQTIPVVATVTRMSGSHEAYAEAARNLSSRIRSLGGAGKADVERSLGTNPDYFQRDGLHPTPAGSERIAATFYSALN